MNPNTEYEKFVQELYQELIKNSGINTIEVMHDTKLEGKSGCKHQIDVCWKYEKDGVHNTVIIECKNYKRKISIGKVRDFYGLLSDLTNVYGIMITKVGYQKGAKIYADHYGINLKELRSPNEKDDCRIGESTISIGADVSRRLFLLYDNWAKESNIDWALYRDRMSSLSMDQTSWTDDYISLALIGGDFVLDEKGQVIKDLNELREKSSQEPECIYYFNNAYVKTKEFGVVKIQAVKFINSHSVKNTTFVLDVRNIVKALIKDTSTGITNFIWKDSNQMHD